MSNLKTFTEIFNEVDAAKGNAEKIAVLHKNSSKQFKEILGLIYNPKVKWKVPEGTPPYTLPQEDENLLRGRIYQEMKRLSYFTNLSPYPDMKKRKLESMFIDMLQTIHPADAKLLCHAKDARTVPQKSVTKKLIEEAFPLLAEKWK